MRPKARDLNQVIRYTMWSVFRASSRLPDDRAGIADEVSALFDQLATKDVVVRGTYDVSGLRADADLMVWWHSPSSDDLQEAYARFRRTALGRSLAPAWSVMALHRPAEFNKSHIPAFLADEEPRAYLCVYPFVRSYEWYLLPDEERRAMLAEHGRMAREYPDVRANTVSGHRETRFVQGFDRGAGADHGRDGFAAKARFALCQHRLVLDVRIDAEAVDGDVFRGEHAIQAGLLRVGGEIAEGESCPVVRRADDAQVQRIGRNRVRAVLLRAGEFGDAIHLARPRAYRLSGGGRGGERRMVGGVEHRLDDLLVAGAAAQHAGERILEPRPLSACGCARAGRPPPSACRGYRCRIARRRGSGNVIYLKRRELAVLRQALDRNDARSSTCPSGGQASANLAPVEENGAGPAIPGVAADLGAGQAQFVAQHVGERARRAARGSPPCAR